jgi:nucleoid-associated protein YgaU
VRRRPWHAPAGVRRALLAACGVALTTTVAAPALATDHERSHHHHQYKRHGAALLDGLPLPQRTVAPTGSPVSRVRVRTVLVRPGDCLWSIAARDLGAGASDSAVDARWRAIYAANHALVGPDPGLVEPGQRLHLPEAGLSGKDAS